MKESRSIGQSRLVFIVALGLLVAFVALFVFMLRMLDNSNEIQWTRLVYLFGSAEAIVFAAVGWLFGKEVHRERAERAEEQADDATSKEREATEEAVSSRERGMALASAIRVNPYGTRGDPGQELLGAVVSEQGLRLQIEQLRRLADELFPPQGN